MLSVEDKEVDHFKAFFTLSAINSCHVNQHVEGNCRVLLEFGEDLDQILTRNDQRQVAMMLYNFNVRRDRLRRIGDLLCT